MFLKLLFIVFFIEICFTYGLDKCKKNDDCEHLKNATCVDSICSCGGSFHVCEEHMSHRTVNRLHKTCSETTTCNIKDSQCHDGFCKCQKGFSESEDLMMCLPVIKNLKDACATSFQCSSAILFSECSENKCICQNTTVEADGKCVKQSALGEDCMTSFQCVTNSSSCIHSKCSCNKGYIASGNRCLPVVEKIGDECFDDVQCSRLGDLVHCSKRTCQCRNFYRYDNTTGNCVKYILLNQHCSVHSDCHQLGPDPSNLICIEGLCKCKVSYREYSGYCEAVNTGSRFFNKKSFVIILTVLMRYFMS